MSEERCMCRARMQVFLRPPRQMLRNLIELSEASAHGTGGMMLHVPVVALYAAMTFAM